MIEKILKAFRITSQGFSVDRVVADPKLNNKFLELCRKAGLHEPALVLNSTLLNARKSRRLSNYRASERTSFPNLEKYRFASEVAVRFLEMKYRVSLDQIICHPDLAKEFDETAARIAPGYTPLQYRWAALNLRKKRLLKPAPVGRLLRPKPRRLGLVSKLNVKKLPSKQGVYVFYTRKEALYVGQARDLRRRISQHLEHSDCKGLAWWFWENGFRKVFLDLYLLSSHADAEKRRALEREVIENLKPRFNLQYAKRRSNNS